MSIFKHSKEIMVCVGGISSFFYFVVLLFTPFIHIFLFFLLQPCVLFILRGLKGIPPLMSLSAFSLGNHVWRHSSVIRPTSQRILFFVDRSPYNLILFVHPYLVESPVQHKQSVEPEGISHLWCYLRKGSSMSQNLNIWMYMHQSMCS